MTPHSHQSCICLIILMGVMGCDARSVAASPTRSERDPTSEQAAAVVSESTLGVNDRGVFPDLNTKITLPLPPLERARALWDRKRGLLTIYVGRHAQKVYPTRGSARLQVDGHTIPMRPGDAAELTGVSLTLTIGQARRDADADGIEDSLDLLLGARKTVLNAAAYGAGYIRLEYPMGDVPRSVGVCTDVVIRAVRNLGVDLQAELHRDIRRSRRSYPMVRRLDKNINHRRVKTLLPYFRRHWEAHRSALNDKDDPLQPGDVVFMDTFPARPGPDHIGIVSNRVGASGHPLIINNWTDGTTTAEMDLLSFVPVTHRYRVSYGKRKRRRGKRR